MSMVSKENLHDDELWHSTRH